MALIDDIRAQARTENAIISRLTGGFEEEVTDVLSAVDRQIRRLVATLETDGGRLVSNQAAIGRALRLRTEIDTVLAEAGFAAVAAPDLDDLTVSVLRGRSIAGAAATETPVSLDVLAALQELGTADILDIGERTATALWRGTLDGVIGARNVTDLVDELSMVTQVSQRQAQTLFDTAVSTFGRQVKQIGLPSNPDDRFVYVGPNDDVTRPFCKAVLADPVRTRDEINSLENGQLPNTLLTGGGFSCRHTWQFIGTADIGDVTS